MSAIPVDNASMDYMPAQEANQAREQTALNRAASTQPQVYNYNVNQANQMANNLGSYQYTNQMNQLKNLNPTAYQGEQEGINTIANGEAGDNQFLRNNAMISGLEGTAPSGINVNGPNSVGGVNTSRIYGNQLLNYRQQRAGEQLGLAQQLQPDSSINAGQGVSAYMNNGANAVNQANQFQQYLNGLQMTGIQGANSNLDQNINAQQSVDNADAANAAGLQGEMIGLAGTAMQAAASGAGNAMRPGP